MPRAARATPKRARGAVARAFLFSDLRDYTTFVETKGDRAAAALLRDYRGLIRREVARFEGAEVKTEGDSFYVVFDSASTALDCAVAIARKCAAHNEKDPERPLKVGIGIHAGETVAFDSQFVGSAVNVASRLGSHARAGEIIVSDTLRGLVRTGQDYPMTDLGPLALKGVSERIHAWSVTALESTAPPVTLSPSPAPHARPAAGQILCPVLIGRESELALIETALDAATGGAGQTVVVAGEAGGGKSAFVRAVESRAHARGFRLLRGTTLESDRTLPYAPFVEAVRSGFRGIEHERLGRVLAQIAPDLAQLFPELGRGDGPAASTEQHRLSVAFHGLFTAFAREGPILIVVEDLHWSDEASLDLLQSLSRELRDSRCVLLANYRSDEMHRRHPLLRTLVNLQRERLATEITLRRLTADEVGQLIRETFASSEATSAEFRNAVFARSEGNPFFTEELLKAMVDSGGIYRTATGWERKPIAELRIPSSIRESVHARVERLSPEAQVALSAASVIGLRFPFEVLRATSGATATDLLMHLRAFIELQLVVEEGGDEDSYAFRHALTREVVYDELLAPERKALHRAVATALESPPRVEPGLLALHLIAAGEAARAVTHLIAAARQAHAADAPREAAGGYERALEIGVPEDQLGPVLEDLARAYQPFDITRARRAAERAVERYRNAGDRRGLSRTLLLQGLFASMLADGRGLELLTAARDVVDDLGDTPELANALIQLGGQRATRGEWIQAGELAVRVLQLAERLEGPRARYGGALLAGIGLVDGSPEEALRLMTQARDVARAGRLIDEALFAWMWMTIAVQRTDRPPSELE
ncbi:MAG: AAA family ATPase, partial [Chloroflexota bacterium]|nr:AAA family ATPase [Chloroflexota bacterium]